ncbi:MAG: zinc ABC transporter substrate-binding protein [Actinobacteria bacterium]|nr:zinc ABC transporter substrate-binding protein [Actinomycetota bacterium]
MSSRPARRAAALALALALAASGCSSGTEASEGEIGDRQVRIATTTNFITDTVRQIAGDRATVSGLMGPGVDPHLYKASAGDVRTLRDADVVFYGGLDLEGRLADLFVELASERTTVSVSGAAPEDQLLEPEEFGGKFDPHVWFDPELWTFGMRRVAETLQRLDPEHAAGYEDRLNTLVAEVAEVDAQCQRLLGAVPERSRVLVTSHDAFNYFGRRYGLDVEAIQGISTAAEATTTDIERIAGVLADREVPAVFVESSVPRQTIEAVIASARAKGQQVEVGGELFSDAAGQEGTPEGTYPGMLRHNCRVVAEGLS